MNAALAPKPVVTVPATENVATSGTVAVSGASIADAWAAQNPGSLALTVTASDGTITMLASGTKLPGSGTSVIEVNGTLAQINADLSTLTFTAGTAAGTGAVTVDIWDQAGVEATKSTSVTISKPVNAVAIAASNASPVENVSNSVITATSGTHAISVGGSGDTVTATGGTETVQANLGNNTITTGTGNDTLRFAGSNNVINAGGGQQRAGRHRQQQSDRDAGGGPGLLDDIHGFRLDERRRVRSAVVAGSDVVERRFCEPRRFPQGQHGQQQRGIIG